MRLQVSDVECPKCGHIFDYDSGWSEFTPYQNKSDAEARVNELNKEYPSITHTIEPCSGGWIICGSSKRD